MKSMREEIRQFAIASECLIFSGMNSGELSNMERETIQHYVATLAAKFPAVLNEGSANSSL